MSEQIKAGYKKTKLGWIPEEWHVYKLRELLSLLTDFEANGSFADVKENVNVLDSAGYAWYVRATDLENKTSHENVKYVDEHSYNFLRKTPLFGEELLITKRGEIGKVYLFEKKTEYATVAPNLYLLKLNDLVLPKYLFYYFINHKGNNSLKRINASTTLGALYKEDVKNLKVSLPSLPEQQKIAQILSTWDKAIAKTEKLITQKQKRKQGLMQQLLTGKKRFTAFVKSDKMKESKLGEIPEDWEVSKLGDIGKVRMCKRVFNSETSKNGDVPFYKIGTFGKTPDAFISQELYESYKKRFSFPKKGEILISASGTLGRAVVYNGETAYYQDSNIVWLDNDESKVLNEFLFYVYKIIRYDSEGGTIKRLYNNIISSAKFMRPTLPEQQRIASVLSTAEQEITKLQSQLQQLQTQKKGLMQKLLTGEVRVNPVK